MALADFDDYIAQFDKQIAMTMTMANGFSGTQRMNQLMRSAALVPGDPAAPVALSDTSAQAMDFLPASANGWHIAGGQWSGNTQAGFTVIIADMLSAQGGLSGTVTTAQTTNLPTAALTRYTSGEGVFAALLTQFGAGVTATTFTVSYTNQAGTSGRTSTAQQIGGTGFREIGRMIPIPLQAGDTGVRSVESVTLAGSTGSVGDLGITLFKPLAMFVVDSTELSQYFDAVSTGKWVGKLNKILPNACVAPIGIFTHGGWGNSSIYLAQA